MDATSLEKKIIYLKGVQNGILQGNQPYVSKYKMQVDFEVQQLEKLFQQLQLAWDSKSPASSSTSRQKTVPVPPIQPKQTNQPVQSNPQSTSNPQSSSSTKEESMMDINVQFDSVSKKINALKEQLFHQNNQIKVLSRNKTYAQSMKINQIINQNKFLYQQIQQYQALYDALQMKMLQPEQKIPVSTSSTSSTSSTARTSQPLKIKPILKKSVHSTGEEHTSRHVNFIDSSNVKSQEKPTLLLKKRDAPKAVIKEVEQEKLNENELMKEFQSTLGALQKLLV